MRSAAAGTTGGADERAGRERERWTSRVRDAVARRAAVQVAARIPADEWARVVSEVMARDVDPDAAADRLLARAFGAREGMRSLMSGGH